ncbi:MAG TPA: GIY-YIG nuclease family protein [Bacillota bacterium]|nr:GIY-YIG nuclease family protein [Bacillota bacterium]HQI16265.1 GIY-YIG nuclease family protein [Bacillota bacterium]HQJ36736.1 GIY-YIG nuclease family protein [Bacillota bacterium]HQL35502.1 GIY-YIG nuclease family protein [Bacillota bacterium]
MKTFIIYVNRTLIKHKAFTLPKEITKKWTGSKKGIFEINEKVYYISVSGKHADNILDLNTTYQAFQGSINEELLYELKKIFCHTVMTLEDPSIEAEPEYLEVEFSYISSEVVRFRVIRQKTVMNAYTRYFNKLAERNEIALSTKHDRDLKHLVNYSSPWIHISELSNHTGVKKCIYMWVDMDKKYIYVGKADDLVKRIMQHQDSCMEYDKCIAKYGDTFNITHFRYDIVAPIIANDMLEALEMHSIRTIAQLLPNRSTGKNELNGIINHSGWMQINNKYSYH